MPTQTVDFAELRALHCKGVSLRQLATEYNVDYGALRTRSSREKWRNTVEKVRNSVTQSVTDQLHSFADRHLSKVMGFAERGMDQVIANLETSPSTKALGDLVTIADTLDRMARRTAKLDDDKQVKPASLTVNVAVSGAATTGQTRILGQVIDVEQVSLGGAGDAKLLAASPPTQAPKQ